MVVVVIIFSNYTFAALNIWSSGKRILLPIKVTKISLWEETLRDFALFWVLTKLLSHWIFSKNLTKNIRNYSAEIHYKSVFTRYIWAMNNHIWRRIRARIILIVQWVSWGVGLDFQEGEFLWTKGHKPSTNPVLFFLPSMLLNFPPRIPQRCYAPPSAVRRNSCYWRLSR